MNRLTDDEFRILQEVWQYLAEHHDPPGSQEPGAEAWWLAAAEDMRVTDLRWKGHPLMRGLLSALYTYLAGMTEARQKTDALDENHGFDASIRPVPATFSALLFG